MLSPAEPERENVGKGTAAHGVACAVDPLLHAPVAPPQFLNGWQERTKLLIEVEDLADRFRFVKVDDETVCAGLEVVAENEIAAGPLAVTPGSLYLYLGSGNATYAAPIYLGTRPSPSSLIAADLHGQKKTSGL
jgi:hypothetical protein